MKCVTELMLDSVEVVCLLMTVELHVNNSQTQFVHHDEKEIRDHPIYS